VSQILLPISLLVLYTAAVAQRHNYPGKGQ